MTGNRAQYFKHVARGGPSIKYAPNLLIKRFSPQLKKTTYIICEQSRVINPGFHICGGQPPGDSENSTRYQAASNQREYIGQSRNHIVCVAGRGTGTRRKS